MRNIIIGTAGHVDHGKTALIKALTGIETDRWEEEKRRGLTIGLGFAHFDLSDGSRVGVVDVPGHEKFIRNMLIGVWGMDLILLVIDAIEGVKPQTVEHLNIIDLLEISSGIIVITKIDMVSRERVDEIVKQARELVKGKSLEDAPVLEVSSITLDGIEELKEAITEQIELTESHIKSHSVSRLPIDRIFVISGLGTIVTGTLIGNSINKDDNVNIMPGNGKARIRSIEVHEQQVDKAYPSQRVALNLSLTGKSGIERGHVVCDGTLSRSTERVDTVVHIVDTCNRIFENWIRVRFFLGTTEVFGRAVLLSHEEGLLPEESGYVQFRLESPVFAFKDDKFIIRDFTNQETLGGGYVLNPFPSKHKRLAKETIELLDKWESAEENEIVKLAAENSISPFIRENDLKYYLPYSYEKIQKLLVKMENMDQIVSYISNNQRFIASLNRIEGIEEQIISNISEFHDKNPLAEGANYTQIRSKAGIDEFTFDYLTERLTKKGIILRHGNIIKLSTHEIVFDERQEELSRKIQELFIEKDLSPPDEKEIGEALKAHEKKEVQDIFKALVIKGKLVRISPDIVLHNDTLKKGTEKLSQYLKQNNRVTVSELRQLLDTSRKYAVPFLEYCDSIGLTVREGNYRKLK
ncbi:selenocysteine-specific translation elongation factor [Candidatus Poribacteria bacterium]|nr:selenocysteine-specific translation elongation factor [Candidatus Poribacteria bacterium]